MDFPQRLRALRREARLSQRGLAERVSVDFTYLSKIENARVEPPSETVLKNIGGVLAEALGLDETELSDELITLAGKIPSDLAETLARNPGAVRFLRSLGDEVRSADEWQRLIQEQETGYRVDSGRGQNRTLSPLSALLPPAFAGEQDVDPPKG